MLNRDSLPVVREFGSVGTGDLPALAAVGLALCGESPLDPPLPGHLISRPADLISVMNSNAAALGDAALAHADLSRIARGAVRTAALTCIAVDGNAHAFGEVVAQASPLPGVAETCTQMRSWLGIAGQPARVQDPYGLRALPQVHGAFLDKLGRVGEVVTAMSSAPAENPLFLPGHPVTHHAAFHAAHLGQALDAVVSAAAQSAQLSFERLSMLMNAELTGLRPFLAVGTPETSGLMVFEYVAGSALVRLRALAAPAGVQSLTLSGGAEDDASCASESARQALDAAESYLVVLACEMVAAVRALRLRGRDPGVPFGVLNGPSEDADLTGDLELAQELLPQISLPG
jgi:histidine ammonia-lyase